MDNNNARAIVSVFAVIVIAAVLGLAGSAGGVTVGGVPVFGLSVALAFLINWIAFVPAWVGKTERFFDLTGSLTYLTVISVAVWLSRPIEPRSLVLWVLVVVWAARLGSFLFLRIRRAGKDSRFDTLKQSFWGFLNVWTIQGLWVSLTLAAALGSITSTHPGTAPVDAFLVAGLAVWAFGFSMEAIADFQKSRWRSDPANEGRFITGGLWSWSRHPNYFGEIVIWTGVAIIAFPTLAGWTYATLISPVFVLFLLTRVSGIPILERQADEMWGGQPDYEEYKKATSVLIPLPPKRLPK